MSSPIAPVTNSPSIAPLKPETTRGTVTNPSGAAARATIAGNDLPPSVSQGPVGALDQIRGMFGAGRGIPSGSSPQDAQKILEQRNQELAQKRQNAKSAKIQANEIGLVLDGRARELLAQTTVEHRRRLARGRTTSGR